MELEQAESFQILHRFFFGGKGETNLIEMYGEAKKPFKFRG